MFEEIEEPIYTDHKLKTIMTGCENHYWIIPNPRKRETVCKQCGLGRNFIVGKHIIEDGKFIEKSQN